MGNPDATYFIGKLRDLTEALADNKESLPDLQSVAKYLLKALSNFESFPNETKLPPELASLTSNLFRKPELKQKIIKVEKMSMDGEALIHVYLFNVT